MALIGSIVALIIFYVMNRSMRNRSLDKHERLREKQEQLLETLRNNKDENKPEKI